MVGSDSGVWLERDPDTVREPDIAFTSAHRLPVGQEVAGYAEVVPDLVVEVASPSERRGETHDKARMWLSIGVRLVWVIYPESRSARVHRFDRPVELMAPEASLDGHDVLPGFACPLAQIFTGQVEYSPALASTEGTHRRSKWRSRIGSVAPVIHPGSCAG